MKLRYYILVSFSGGCRRFLSRDRKKGYVLVHQLSHAKSWRSDKKAQRIADKCADSCKSLDVYFKVVEG